MSFTRHGRTLSLVTAITLAAAAVVSSQQRAVLPAGPLAFGAFSGSFDADGTFRIQGQGWPALAGTWKATGAELELVQSAAGRGRGGCDSTPARYTFKVVGRRLTLTVIADSCQPRRMILDGSIWRPAGEPDAIPERHIVRTVAENRGPLPRAASADGSWPSFRGPVAAGIAENQHLPDDWDVEAGTNILWRKAIPGLGHSSPVVWGDRIFVTSAVSDDPDASFKPGLYGDGDASTDRSRQRWMVYALDKHTGAIIWERLAHESLPIDKRHMKSTYASGSPATNGRIVVAWFGSHGVYAYDVSGHPLWTVDVGRMNLGAYDIPTFEWGPASSPIIWNDRVILQVDTQADSFVLALNAETGETIWKTERDELPSWGTPAVLQTSKGPELVTNAANFIRGYDPETGRERWRLGGSSKITAPTPILANDLIIVASGRAPERPIFAIRPGSSGDITLRAGATSSDAVAWSKRGRGPYMPTPLAYEGILYVLANNGIFDAYDLQTGEEIYRQRLPVIGSGYSSSPIAADGRIYLSSEDGDMLVVAAGREFELLGTHSMGELIMATPAISEGVMYVKTVKSLIAVGGR